MCRYSWLSRRSHCDLVIAPLALQPLPCGWLRHDGHVFRLLPAEKTTGAGVQVPGGSWGARVCAPKTPHDLSGGTGAPQVTDSVGKKIWLVHAWPARIRRPCTSVRVSSLGQACGASANATIVRR